MYEINIIVSTMVKTGRKRTNKKKMGKKNFYEDDKSF
jgi:hypothetical protein